MDPKNASDLVMQLGFAGLCLILLVLIFYAAKWFFAAQERMVKAVDSLASNVASQTAAVTELRAKTEALHTHIMARPCATLESPHRG